MRVEGFVGPTNVSRSRTFDAEDTINLFPILRDAAAPKSGGWLSHTPGLTAYLKFDTGPVRGLFSQDNRLFAVAGAGFYELFGNRTALQRGTVRVDANPAQICTNGVAGSQMFMTSGGLGYTYDMETGGFLQITDTDFPFPAIFANYTDGYFVTLKANSTQFQISALLDGDDWNGLDIAQVNESSDNKVALAVVHRNLWLFGTKQTEIWTNIGTLNFPFAPIPGAPMDLGIIAPYSVAVVDNAPFWLGGDARGSGVVYRATGYTTAEKVSTFAVDHYLQSLDRIDDAVGWTYQQGGHIFYCLYLPHADSTLVYDVATGLWHKRAIWDPTDLVWLPHRARCHTFCFGRHFVGDRLSGTVYTYDLDVYEDTVPV